MTPKTTPNNHPPICLFPMLWRRLLTTMMADTYNWDTCSASALTMPIPPLLITGRRSVTKLRTFRRRRGCPSYKAKGIFGPWQLTVGGDGKNIRLVCPFLEGTYEAGGTNYDLTDYKVVIEVGMEWVPDPDQFAFTVSGNDKIGQIVAALDQSTVSQLLKDDFAAQQKPLSDSATARVIKNSLEWMITDGKTNYYIFFNLDKYQDQFLHIYMFEDAWRNNLKVLQDEVSKRSPRL